jgi:endo-1,4-beta-mannosidase
MILEYKNYVSNEFVEEIQNKVFPFLNLETKETTYNRDGVSVRITEKEELIDLDNKISKLFSELSTEIVNKRFKPQFSSGDSGYEYHLYRPGDICHYHADGEIMNGFVRYATVILFLSDNDDGELVFPTQNIEIKPRKGKIVVFPPYGFFGHYSKPSTNNREILMTWFVYNGVEAKINAT